MLTGPGGGGGGGFYGGGGGGGACFVGSSGGGGGSSLVPEAGLALTAVSEPEVQITYTLVPPTIEIVSPAGGAAYPQGEALNASYSCSPPEGTSVETCEGSVANGAALDTSTLGSHAFTVSAADTDGGKAHREVAYTVVAAPPPPIHDTTLGSHPKKKVVTGKKKVKVKFTFSSAVAGATFQCKLDKGTFAPCTSPKSYKVKPGKHTFSVEAVGSGGTDPSPATFKFTVKRLS